MHNPFEPELSSGKFEFQLNEVFPALSRPLSALGMRPNTWVNLMPGPRTTLEGLKSICGPGTVAYPFVVCLTKIGGFTPSCGMRKRRDIRQSAPISGRTAGAPREMRVEI